MSNQTIVIPIPDNPFHVDNLATLGLLKAQGFEGIDTSLDESLFEYGRVWRVIGNETLFVYRHPSIPRRFDRTILANDLDVSKEYDWVDWSAFLSYTGQSMDEWMLSPLTHKISDLLGCYGVEEIFGSSYWEGFKVAR